MIVIFSTKKLISIPNIPIFIQEIGISKNICSRTATGMDGTLTLIFAFSETITDIKKFIYWNKNAFKSYVKFQSFKDLAQKLGAPR